ncbi:MAG: transcription termination/antitermination protein NusA [Lewinellaceae bacterium]|nr:transcription termination/antitermination protein NusA [Lewinellaceae bacterium]
MVNLVDVFSDFKSGKNIDRPTMVRVLEDVFRTLIKKKYGTDDNFDVIVNTNKGDLEIWRVREVVADGEVTEDRSQLAVSEAARIDESLNVGDECYEQLSIEDFGRRAIMAARQTLVSRIMELEKDEVFRKYSERVFEMVTGEISQVMKKEMLVLDDATGNELVLPRTEMIRGDYYRKGDVVRGIIKKVDMRNNTPYIMLSRTDPGFLRKLLEGEVPEIEDGIIEVKNIVRLPGERAKVAVESHDDRIDPVGACVGMKGSRIHGIVRELRNENIDIINYTNNVTLYIQRSLTPAKISNIDLDNERMHAAVYLDADQVSLAIGKGGSNIKLASKLTGYEIDVYRNQAEYEIDDVDLEEFSDEIEAWVIEALKGIGCDTARQVLELNPDEIVRRTDLEEETVQEVMRILANEFEEGNDDETPANAVETPATEVADAELTETVEATIAAAPAAEAEPVAPKKTRSKAKAEVIAEDADENPRLRQKAKQK